MNVYASAVTAFLAFSGVGPRDNIVNSFTPSFSRASVPGGTILGVFGPFVIASILGVAFVLIGKTDFAQFSNNYIKIVVGLSFVLHAIGIVIALTNRALLGVLGLAFSFLMTTIQILASLSLLEYLFNAPPAEGMLLTEYRGFILSIVGGKTVSDEAGKIIVEHGKTVIHDIAIAVSAGIILGLFGIRAKAATG